jgi:prolipoprotein diacylglyceryltransferase
MLLHPSINPVALQLGPLAVHWYGLTYLAACSWPWVCVGYGTSRLPR